MMKVEEMKNKIITKVNELIDLYFGENEFVDKMVNATLKVMLNTKQDSISDFLAIMADEDGNIDADTIVEMYASQIGNDGIPFDIKHYIKSDIIRNILPNKSLIITKEDIEKMLH